MAICFVQRSVYRENPILIKPNSKNDYLEIQEWLLNKYGHMKEQFSCTEHNTNQNLNGKIIRTSDSLKILGVTIDNKLNFNTSTTYVTKLVKGSG